MTGKKKLLLIGAAVFILLAAIVLLLLLQPSDPRLLLNPENANLQIGQTQRLQILSEEGKTQKLSAVWSSQSDVVATVDEKGVVTAVSAGEARITAQVECKGKEYSLSTIVTVIDSNQLDKVMVAGDTTQEKPDFEGKCFTIYSATNGVTADMDAGTIQFSDEVKQTEVFFADSMNYPHSDAWELRGTIDREDINQTLFLSFGIRDESGKDQWFCLYGTGLSRQRYWNWANTKYDIDNVHVGYNQAAASFYKRDAKADGNRLDFIAVLKDDVLKVYFGNRQEEMSLAWSLPLTKEIFGGFAAGSKYQLGINTVDACEFTITDLSCKNGEDVQDLGGVVGGKYADIKVAGNKFQIADSSIGVSYNGKQGTVDVKQTVKETITFFAGNETNYADRWELSGTIEKEQLSDTVFLSFGVRDSSGKTQWFCIYQNTLSLQKDWDWNETKQKVDGTYVKFNQPACSFFWKEKDMGAEKLNFKLILHDDVLTVYFGNDKYPLSQAWNLPLTQDTYGGFKTGSGYQIGIATVDPLNMHIKDIVVNNGDKAAQIPEFTEDGRFYIANQTVNVISDPVTGTLNVADDPDKSEIIFAASPYDVDSKSWQLTGTVTKTEMKNLFLSFGVKDKTGKEQWFCIYQKGLARQRYYNWADTKQDVDGKHVFANPASEHFFYKTPSLGGDKLHYAIIVQDDILKAYFGNDLYDMTLAWYLPLTEELWGGFAPGTEYQLGINSVDPCLHTHTDVSVVTGDAVNDVWYKAQLYNVSAFENESNAMQEKMETSAKDDITTVFIGDSFFDQDAFFKNFSGIYRNKEAVCVGISTTTTYHWESFTKDWLKSYNPKNIVVNVGTNNLILQPPYNSVENVTDGLQSLLSMLKDTFPGTQIYWFSIAPRNDLDREDDKILINAAMKQWCDENGVIYVESPIIDPNADCVDGLHPTEQTYEKYVQALTAAGCEIVAADTSGYQFFVDTNSTGVTAKPTEGTITISNFASKTETLFAADAESVYNETWQFTGTVTKTEMKNLFLSFGIRDENGKEQWLCIYNKGLARQRYWNWADTAYAPDGKYVIANPATEHFYYKTPSLGGDKLHFKLVLRDDVLKAYFGNDQFDMTLAWELPLTEELWGGFAAGSKYQLGINTVDPCAHSFTNVEILTGDAVPEEEKPDYSNYHFFTDSLSAGVTANPEEGTLTIGNSVSKTETMFKANADETYSHKWQLTGTVTKTEMKNLFLSFGVRDENGKEQWFCVYKKGLARQRYWNWEDTVYQPDGEYVIANPASEHFYYKTPSLGGDKLHYKLVIMDDVLKAYFGNDQFDMSLAWELPLTEELWGGFAVGSKYQLGINTVDPCAHNHSNMQVLTGDAVVEELPGESDQPESSETQYLLYSEDFESYTDKVVLSAGTNDSGWIYSQKSTDGYAYIENGKLYFAGSKYDVLYLVDGETWGNYTVEADISYNADNAGWAALAYNVQSDIKWQKASVGTTGNVGLNGYNAKWTNNDATLNKTTLDKMGLANTAAKGQLRLKISVKNTSATLWVAQYENGVLGDWSEGFTISNIYKDAQTGSIGFVSSTGSLGSIAVDNIKVYSESLVTFAEDFDDYAGKISLNAGDNSGSGKPGIFFHQGTNGATSYIQDGRLYLDASSQKSNYEHIYFTAGMNWTDYIVEMDLCTSADWIGMLHRVGGENNFQKAGVNIGGGTSLYGYTGVGKWQHNTAAPYKGTTTVKPSANQVYRLRVTVVNQEATLEIALYDANGVLGEYTQVLNASGLYEKHTKGSVGLMLNNNGNLKAWIDNVVVSRYHTGEINGSN